MPDAAGATGHTAEVSPGAPPPRDGRDPLPTVATPLVDSARLATFDALFGQSPMGAGIFDADCRYVMVNDALQAIIGLPASRVLGRRVEDVLGPLGLRVAANLRAAMSSGEPLVNREFVGSTYAHDGQPRAFLASYFGLADDAGQLLGAAALVTDITEHRRTQRDLSAANERLALLSRVSAALASCLDESDALRAFANLVVPDFADHCAVDLVDEDSGEVRRAAIAHADNIPVDHAPWRAAGQLGDDSVRGAMTIPLLARGEVLGTVSFASSTSERLFDRADAEVAEELAARVSVAVDNARLFAQETRIALTLQRSLLPEELPVTPGLTTAAVYQPAARDGSVGGDWYDVIALPCGRVGLVMGDVMGRGVPAAALMGQLRAAVRAFAAQDLPPGELLGYLDGVVRGLAYDTLVTCVYAVYDPVEETLTLANAGHLPPLLVTAEGAERLVEHGVVLGAGSASYDQVEVAFRSDAVLALYTDGLVERRTADIDLRIDALATMLVGRDEPLDRLCADAAAMSRDTPDVDDVAVMLVRPDAAERPRIARLDVVPHAARVRDVRQFAAETLREWGEPAHLTEPVQLIVSELVTNVIRHASGHAAGVRLERHADRLVIAVVDPDASPPRRGRAALDDEGGRGLHLVDAVADRWGARQLRGGGKVVWCELFAAGVA